MSDLFGKCDPYVRNDEHSACQKKHTAQYRWITDIVKDNQRGNNTMSSGLRYQQLGVMQKNDEVESRYF